MIEGSDPIVALEKEEIELGSTIWGNIMFPSCLLLESSIIGISMIAGEKSGFCFNRIFGISKPLLLQLLGSLWRSIVCDGRSDSHHNSLPSPFFRSGDRWFLYLVCLLSTLSDRFNFFSLYPSWLLVMTMTRFVELLLPPMKLSSSTRKAASNLFIWLYSFIDPF